MKCQLKDIENKMFVTVTCSPEKIIRGLEQSGIRYFVQIDDSKAMFAYSADGSQRISEIISRSENDEAVCRFISHSREYTQEEYSELLPEIAKIMEVSVSKLHSFPVDIQNRITNAYINCCYADTFTIRRSLNRIINLSTDLQPKEQPDTHKPSRNRSISER